MLGGEFRRHEHWQQDVEALLGIGRHDLARRHQLFEDLWRRHLRGWPSRHRASQHDLGDLLGMPERELLRDHSAHRYSEHFCLCDSERPDQVARVIGHALDGIDTLGLVAESCSAIVKIDALETVEERQRRNPPGARHPKSHDQQQRLAVAVSFVVEVDVTGFDYWHREKFTPRGKIKKIKTEAALY